MRMSERAVARAVGPRPPPQAAIAIAGTNNIKLGAFHSRLSRAVAANANSVTAPASMYGIAPWTTGWLRKRDGCVDARCALGAIISARSAALIRRHGMKVRDAWQSA